MTGTASFIPLGSIPGRGSAPPFLYWRTIMNPISNPFIRGYNGLSIQRMIAIAYDDDCPLTYLPLHASQSHLRTARAASRRAAGCAAGACPAPGRLRAARTGSAGPARAGDPGQKENAMTSFTPVSQIGTGCRSGTVASINAFSLDTSMGKASAQIKIKTGSECAR
jgi:hypothetical protein